MADLVLAYCRKAFNWFATRDDKFQPPIVKGMARTKPKERARDRVLTDDELRALWKASGETVFGKMMRFILLTACRRGEAAGITHDEIDGTVWVIPARRYKSNATW